MKSTIVSLYKNKGDTQNYYDYHRIKLAQHHKSLENNN